MLIPVTAVGDKAEFLDTTQREEGVIFSTPWIASLAQRFAHMLVVKELMRYGRLLGLLRRFSVDVSAVTVRNFCLSRYAKKYACSKQSL